MDALVQSTLSQEVAIGGSGGGEAAGHAHAQRTQL